MHRTARDRYDAARLRPLKRKLRAERLRQNATFLAAASAALTFISYVAATR